MAGNMNKSTIALVLVLFVLPAAAQDGAMHAPDGRAPKLIRPLYVGPKTNAPFTATARTESVQIMPDNSTITAWNARAVARDMDGRIFQERRTFVPKGGSGDGEQEPQIRVVEYSDPQEHTVYICNPRAKLCELNNYFPLQAETLAPVGLQPDGRTFLTRENLGADTYEGLDVQRSRETYTYYKQTIGNTNTIVRVVDYWYSPALAVNVKVVRHDPRDGDETLWLTGISQSAPDPETFKLPEDYQVVDRRIARPANRQPEDAQQQQ